eukprot:c22506_g1_i1 orf=79-1188(-)
MAAARKKLTRLFCGAAAEAVKQRRSLHSPTRFNNHYSPSPAQRSFSSSSLEQNVACEHLGSAHLSLLCSPHGPSQYLAPDSSSFIPSSYRSPPFFSPPSLISQSATPLYYPSVDLPSLCQILYIGDGKISNQTNSDDSSSQETACKNAHDSSCGETACKNTHTHLHQDGLVKMECSTRRRSLWSSQEIINWPNAISFGRLLLGPVLAWLIVEGHLQLALSGLIIAGASDWLDGYIARRKGIDSVFGTYLDPLADKVLICCIALSMAHAGYLSSALVGLVIARDAALIGGSFIHRAHSMNWQVSSLQKFFDVMNGGVQKVKPLYISKINTVFQLALVGVALMQPAFGVEDTYSIVPLLRQAHLLFVEYDL